MSAPVIPFSLKDAPALIERLLPVQKLSAEAYKEQMANQGKTLTALGSYWKGRKPLIMNKACILGCLLPATDEPARDLTIFEKLMAMDDESFVARWKRRPKPKEILGSVSIANIYDYFVLEPEGALPASAPVDWSDLDPKEIKVTWREDITELERRRLEVQMLPRVPYRDRVAAAKRPEEVMDTVHDHIWDMVNTHLGTFARSIPELVEQLGIMRFDHRPRMADTFCGSGQIPFEASRLGCDVYASDLNPVACMLTWGAFHIVGGASDSRAELTRQKEDLVERVKAEVDKLGIETDGRGWQAKAFLYCAEARCPQTGWTVPLLPSLIISRGKHVIVELIPDTKAKRYNICLRTGVSAEELAKAAEGTIRADTRGRDTYLTHKVDGVEYRTKISTLRGDFRRPDGSNGNKVRLWEKSEFMPRPDDLYQERLYAIHWMRLKKSGKTFDYEFRGVTAEDMDRERTVEVFMSNHLAEWQAKGWVPDMRIEVGGPPRYQGLDLIRSRGWTHWHHLFNPRQLLVNGLTNRYAITAELKFGVNQAANFNSKLSRWNNGPGVDAVIDTFYNQALNTIYNYGSRSSRYIANQIAVKCKNFPLPGGKTIISCSRADSLETANDIFVTDPPYGDAIKYEEILEFFIAWLRKSPPSEFEKWVWDSRRSFAIQGEGEDFRRGMVAAYKRMTECMPDNGIQVIQFTHQSGSIWADMANIVWASGLSVTAAWYVVTETDSALREGSHVKGTVLLVVRKRQGTLKATRDDLAWEIQEEVEEQIKDLTGLNQKAKGFYRDENVFEDADIQMAGYAAALRVLTRYAIIDGRDMATEAIRPRVKGETTFVDALIAFAVDTANQCLVPQGIPQGQWDKLTGAERFYLKMLDMEARGAKTLDNYQNFAKAFKVRDFQTFMASRRANNSRLKNAVEFGRTEMNESSELYQSVLRAVLYAIMELAKNIDGTEVLAHLILNIPNYYGDMTQRELAVDLADYLAKRLEEMRPEEASAARVLSELVKSQRLG
jgi:putative DNA methylase